MSTSPLHTFRLIAADIKLAHSVFAMPFAILAAFMAAAPGGTELDWRRFGGQLALIVVAMVFARTFAMLTNRVLDREIDRENQRTAGRAIPSGRLAVSNAWAALSLCAVAFIATCAAFAFLHENWWPSILAPFVLLWLGAYPLLKRFTALCHIYLGSSLAISPLAAAIAIDPQALAHQPALWLLSGMVLCWVAGFDIIYALQDVQIDRAQGLYSMPSRWGEARAMWVSRGLHVAAMACLVAVVLVDRRFGVLFGIGAVLVKSLLFLEHVIIARWGTGKITLAFFTLNGVISCVLGVLGVIDILLV